MANKLRRKSDAEGVQSLYRLHQRRLPTQESIKNWSNYLKLFKGEGWSTLDAKEISRRAAKARRKYKKSHNPLRKYKKSYNPLHAYPDKVGYTSWKDAVTMLRSLKSMGDAGLMAKAGARKTPTAPS